MMLIVGMAVLWAVPLVVTAIFVVMVIREDRAERRELEREVRALKGVVEPVNFGPVPIRFALTDERFDPRVHGRADHLRI